MKRCVAILGLALLAACGADGEPVPPEPRETPPGPGMRFDVTGSAEIGVAKR
ncbi:hypothetical protein [Roseivivax isoporae]|uniref:Argininosuccinate lyase n=1 Tax=Roseivivax isoporae LMG 25204 TaxID=1449351 RepID=X7F422_9RHOB|nr:hypothetical protein [Roseivivax isoporae]ETX27657.1 argininosuccinate lyase [Roseivivax isoporae LMG 25204]